MDEKKHIRTMPISAVMPLGPIPYKPCNIEGQCAREVGRSHHDLTNEQNTKLRYINILSFTFFVSILLSPYLGYARGRDIVDADQFIFTNIFQKLASCDAHKRRSSESEWVQFEEYILLTGKRSTNFITKFHTLKDDDSIVCCRYWQLIPAQGCSYKCTYCFCQLTPSFRYHPEWLRGMVYTNLDKMIREVQKWMATQAPTTLVVGALQDGLLFENAFQKHTGKPLTHWIIPEFAEQDDHELLFLSKSVEIQHALELQPTDKVIFTWSINSVEAAGRYEIGVPSPLARIEAAQRMKKAGHRIRIRLDPMIPYDGWQEGYAEIIDRLNELQPEMVTVGALRAHSSKALRTCARKNGRDISVFDFLTTEKDPSGFKDRIPYEQQLEMFRFALDRLDDIIIPALCKEDRQLWDDLGLKFRGCACIQNLQDQLFLEAPEVVRSLADDTQNTATSLPNSGCGGCAKTME